MNTIPTGFSITVLVTVTLIGVGCGIAGALLIQTVMILLISGADRWEAPEGILVINVLPFVFTLGIMSTDCLAQQIDGRDDHERENAVL